MTDRKQLADLFVIASVHILMPHASKGRYLTSPERETILSALRAEPAAPPELVRKAALWDRCQLTGLCTLLPVEDHATHDSKGKDSAAAQGGKHG